MVQEPTRIWNIASYLLQSILVHQRETERDRERE
eukprot:COSAG03_NODE_17407_length_376_cov_0.913357_1_plen_33_part_10